MTAEHETDGGFHEDMARLTRRRALALAAAAMIVPGAARAACTPAAPEMAGPFPADGTNRVSGRTANVLTEAGVIREDIRPSFAGFAGTADGVPTVLEIALTDSACAPLAGAAVYLWQCDAAGRYSLYEIPDSNYLRGMAVAGDAGRLSFVTVFPGCYPGRWPHFHLQVFRNPEAAVTGRDALLTTQLAIDGDASAQLYASDRRYAASVGALAALSLGSDRIFRNNSAAEMSAMTVAMTGDAARGVRMTATFSVPV